MRAKGMTYDTGFVRAGEISRERFDPEVAEPGADLDPPVSRPVDQLERDHLLAGELEHGQARPLPHIDAPELPVPEREVEVE
jgi:hypothetical protein